MKLPFTSQGDILFAMFEESAANIKKTADKFDELIQTWSNVPDKVAEITELEHAGDNITHRIIAHMHRHFFTPIDREDISQLSHTMDDVVDFLQSAADAMMLYRIKAPTQRAKELSKIIVQASAELDVVIPNLRRGHRLKQTMICCEELNRLENEADTVYRKAMGELFDNTTDIAEVIKWREIYEHMESATDRCEDIANILEGVALKNA